LRIITSPWPHQERSCGHLAGRDPAQPLLARAAGASPRLLEAPFSSVTSTSGRFTASAYKGVHHHNSS
jgi:hypothetical protein